MDSALAGVVDAYPLTAMQEGMLFHSLAEEGSGVYVNQIITPVTGDLAPALLRQAWSEVVARHDVLRTGYVWDGLDDPLQVVHEAVEHPWEEIDLSALAPDDQKQQIEDLLVADRGRGFDVAAAPLSRTLLIRTGQQDWQWVWSVHHLVADGWSSRILLDEAAATYRSLAQDSPRTLDEQPPYRGFVEHYLARDTGAEQEHWRARLAGFTKPHDLTVPGLPPQPAASGYRTELRVLDPALAEDLAALARSHHVTVNTVFVAIWSLVVARWAATTDVVFGTTVAGRPPTLAGSEQATGLFINTLPARINVPPAQRLGEWLGDIQRAQVADRRYELASLADVQRWSDAPDGEALFESILVFENYPPGAARHEDDSIALGQPRHVEQSNYPLAVLVVPGEELRVGVVHDLARLAAPAADSLLDQITAMARAFASDPNGSLSGFTLLDEDREAQVAALSHGPALREAEEEPPATVLDTVANIARRHPDQPAVAYAGRRLTYAALDEASSRLARALVERGVRRGATVGLHLPRSLDLPVAIIGILKAGAAYVPLDPTYPRAHLAGLIEDTAISYVVTTTDLAPSVTHVDTLVLLDDPGPDDPTTTLPSVAGEDLAYVIHTSGSTGRPKGVMVTHDTLAASTAARPQHYGAPMGRFLLLSSYAFDSSVAGIFWTLTTGGVLVLPEPGQERDAEAILALAEREQVTHTLTLPSLYQVLLEQARNGQLDSLQLAIVAGEACPAAVLDAHRTIAGHAELHNEYGPTEATVWCTVHRATGDDEGWASTHTGGTVPIGRPIPGSDAHLLDAYGNRVPLGFPGELYVGGAGVTRGYFKRPDLTAERFVTITLDGHPQRLYRTGDLAAYTPEGTLLYLGRTDQQLKIRGHRLESGAIEARLRAHPAVAEAAVLGRPLAGRAGAQLVAYVVPTDGPLDPRRIAEDMRGDVPDYMVPDVVVPIEAVPRLPNGKLDAASLPDPRVGPESHDRVTARTPEEEILAGIWCDLLGLEAVGVQDDFFSLGGDSIVSIRMVSRARQAGLRVEPSQVAGTMTIERLARDAQATRAAPPDDGPGTGPVPLSPIQAWFFDQDFPVPDHWNQAILRAMPDDVDEAALGSAVQAVLEHHDMLRARFVREDGSWHQSVADPGTENLTILTAPTSDLDPVVADLQASLSLSDGPVARFALIRRPSPAPPALCVVAHHLVVDAVSWSILLEDLATGYQQAASGAAVALPPRTTSFRAWTQHQVARSSDAGLARWQSQLPPPPEATRPPPAQEAHRRLVSRLLDPALTHHLLTDANDAYGTRPEDLIVAALPAVLDDGSGSAHALVEGHGRAPADGMDVSRTLGWFTVQYPVALPAHLDEPDVIKHTKEALRSASSDAVDYGVQRYLHRHDRLATVPEPSVLVNYLGRADASTAGLFEPLPAPEASSRHPENRMTHHLELMAAVEDAALTLRWYHGDPDRAAEIDRMADDYLSSLESLIAHCLDERVGGFTPSDFPVADLGQDELDEFLDGLT